MGTVLRQTIILLVLSVILGLGVNLVSPTRISYVGEWHDLAFGNEPVVPPENEPGDAPFISLNVAQMLHNQDGILFVDSREVEEFECGTIPGSINIPFDYLPDENLEEYFDSVFGGPTSSREMVTFCSGEECDLSLHLSRNMIALGYSNIFIFFGGSREWENAGLEVERRRECEE